MGCGLGGWVMEGWYIIGGIVVALIIAWYIYQGGGN